MIDAQVTIDRRTASRAVASWASSAATNSNVLRYLRWDARQRVSASVTVIEALVEPLARVQSRWTCGLPARGLALRRSTSGNPSGGRAAGAITERAAGTGNTEL